MSSRTFYIEPDKVQGKTATLDGEELRHARTVLRLGPGDEVQLVDGLGNFYRAELTSISQEGAELAITSTSIEKEPAFSLTVAMGIVRGERFEWAIQKCTELGAAAFIPLVTERTEVKVTEPWSRRERLEKIIAAACKQSERARFPELRPPLEISELDPDGFDLPLLLWESGSAPSLKAAAGSVSNPGSCLLVIGPVGGFTHGEVKFLKQAGFTVAGFGPRILRTETAATAAVAVLGHLFGDLD